MEAQDFRNALCAIGEIRDKIMSSCNSHTSFDPYTISTVRVELNTIEALENARKALVELRDYLLIEP